MSDLKDLPDNDPKEISEDDIQDNQKMGLPIDLGVLRKKRDWKGIWIKRSICVYSEITWIEKLLWVEIDHLSQGEGCFAGNKYLAKFLQIHPVSVSRYISHLKELGLIEQFSSEDGQRYLKTNHEIFNELERGLSNLLSSPQQFAEHKNTVVQSNISKETVTNVTVKDDSQESSFEKHLPNRFQRLSPISELPSQEESIDDYIKPGTGEYAVINAWNKLLPPARQHTKFNTNIILQITRYLDQMRNGVFGDPSRRHWDGKWIDRHKINMKEFAERKWTFREICKTIEGPLGDIYKEGFWPQDKSKLPKSLADALYNSHTQSSFFVMAYYDPPGPLKSQPMKDPHKGITEDLVSVWNAIDPKAMKPGDWRQYSLGIKGLEKYLENIDWENYGARQMFPGGQKGNPYTLVMEYVRWMGGQSPDLLAPSHVAEKINWSMIKPDFWMWKRFQEAVNLYWGKVFLCIRAEGRD